jgi:Zn-finger nucleic acid-binding protein
MKCPIDGSDLVMTERQGIEIDYCPKCRGVWLDRGELDKIIDRSAAPAAQQPAPTPWTEPAAPAHQPQHQYGHDQHYQLRHKKKKSFLSEIFDF